MGVFKSGNRSEVPLDAVLSMKSQGQANSQIIQALQREGYSSSQIFDAISQSESNAGSSSNNSNSGGANQNPSFETYGSQMPPIQQPVAPQFSQSVPQQSGSSIFGQSSPEELVEAIIDEKWNELIKDINKIVEWKQKADNKLVAMDTKIQDLQIQIDRLQQAVINKISDYDKNIVRVSAQLNSMEQVFTKTIPTLVKNVNTLDSVTRRARILADRPVKTRVAKPKPLDDSVKVDSIKIEVKNEKN